MIFWKMNRQGRERRQGVEEGGGELEWKGSQVGGGCFGVGGACALS